MGFEGHVVYGFDQSLYTFYLPMRYLEYAYFLYRYPLASVAYYEA